MFVNAYARALEVIPRQLCDNAGFDATDVLSRLRNKHAQPEEKGKHFGVDIATGVADPTTPPLDLPSAACAASTQRKSV